MHTTTNQTSRAQLFIAIAGLGLSFALAVPAEAARIRGRVPGGAGYAISGTSSNGEAVSQRLDATGKFSLVFPGTTAHGASLQLVGPGGHYFGPIVLRQHGSTAYIALAGKPVNLRDVVLHEGYATLKRPLAKKAVDRTRTARADAQGKPLGASRLGLVAQAASGLVHLSRDAVPTDPGEDEDGDGIINAYDADDDGDLVLDNADADNSHESGGVFSTLFVTDLTQSLNVNVGAVSQAAIDAIIQNDLNLVFYFDAAQLAGETILSADVDCFTLPYCAPGTGTAESGGVSESPPDFPRGPWIDYDLNGDGFPNLEPIVKPDGTVYVASIRPLVPTAQIAPGDAFDVVFTTATGTVRLPRSLPPYFVTTPAVVGYDAGAGPQTITYPVAPGAPGTGGNPIALTGDLLTLTFYRPQRPAIAGAEEGSYIDMGHLHYGIPLNANNQEVACAPDYSALSSTLSPVTAGDFALQLFPLVDSADDAAPSADRTLSFTIDLGACLRRAGVDPSGTSLMLGITATGESRPGGVDRSAQFLTVQMP